MARFKFNAEIRPFCVALADLIHFSNRKGGQWAVGSSRNNPRTDDGVYGRADKTLDKIIELELSTPLRDRLEIEWGSCGDPIDDVEYAIQAVMDEMEEEAKEMLAEAKKI